MIKDGPYLTILSPHVHRNWVYANPLLNYIYWEKELARNMFAL